MAEPVKPAAPEKTKPDAAEPIKPAAKVTGVYQNQDGSLREVVATPSSGDLVNLTYPGGKEFIVEDCPVSKEPKVGHYTAG